MAAIRDGERVTCQGIGLADAREAVRAECSTVYDIGSVTKSFTAAAVMKLQMMGALDVHDPIRDHLGGAPADKRAITIHHLLTHTSGLPDQLGDDYEPLSREDMVAGAMASELLSRPGAEHRYSNLGYSLLAAIVEEASAMGYEEFLAKHLFAPAGMTDTGYVRPRWSPGQVAVEHDRRGAARGAPFEHPWASDGPYWNLRGNGGLLSSARDMLRWHAALDGEDVLDQAAKDAMFSPHVAEDDSEDTHYGYGWMITSEPGYGRIAAHDGANERSLAVTARLLDEDVGVFWASNHAALDGEWDLALIQADLTLGIANAARGSG